MLQPLVSSERTVSTRTRVGRTGPGEGLLAAGRPDSTQSARTIGGKGRKESLIRRQSGVENKGSEGLFKAADTAGERTLHASTLWGREGWEDAS